MKVHFDPEPQGYHNATPSRRHLKRFRHLQDRRNTTRALSDCIGTLPDGSTYIVRKIAGKIVGEQLTAPTIHINRRELLGDITDYIEVADRVGLDAATVAKLYRERRDNGYLVRSNEVTIETNATFRGGDH